MADEQAYNHLGEIAAKLETALSQIVRTAAFNVQAGYQQRCRVDTAFQKNSAYVVTSGESTYGEAASTAHAANPKAVMLPEIEHPTSKTEADVAVGANYALVNEVGGVHHTGDGAMAKAVENERQPFINALGKLEDLLK